MCVGVECELPMVITLHLNQVRVRVRHLQQWMLFKTREIAPAEKWSFSKTSRVFNNNSTDLLKHTPIHITNHFLY